MLQFKRRVGEGVDVGGIRLTHVVVGDRHGVKVEAPGYDAFILFTREPRSQWRFGIISDADITRCELPARKVTRVFTPEEGER